MEAVSSIDISQVPLEDLLGEIDLRVAARKGTDDLRFEKQLAFKRDPSHFKAALCGRRAGKTRGFIYDFRDSMERYPGDTNVFIELTRPSAKKKFYRPFIRVANDLGWGLDFHETDLEIRHPNGAVTIIVGADNWKEIDKIRGLERVRLACIDECGSQKPANLQYLVEDVLEPGLMDVNGTMVLGGTPGMALSGYWYEVTGMTPPKPGWSTHRWTVYDNPFLNGAEFIRALLERRGWDEKVAKFIREYLGRWVKDLTRLIFAYSKDNVIDTLPAIERGWTFILSMDYGTANATAFCVLGYPPIGRKVFIFKSFKQTGLAPTEVADITRDLIEEFKPARVIGDLHGLGKAYAQELVKRHGIAVQAANKADKRGVIEYVSDAFRTGQLLNFVGNKGLDTELETLLWNEDYSDIADGQDDHESEALVYGYRECSAYANAVSKPVEDMDDLPSWVDRPGWCHEDEKPYWAMEEEW